MAAMNQVKFTILGEPASKANSRKIVQLGGKNITVDGKMVRAGGRVAVIKSDKALGYAKDFRRQLPRSARVMFAGPIRVTMTIYYASERPDLDESLILDLMQPLWLKVGEGGNGKRVLGEPGVYINDRQIVERHVYKRIDRRNPRAEIEVTAMEPQAMELELSQSSSAPDTFDAIIGAT
jgi:Holliday junction resolvase RusA-like endonuclease